MAKARQLLGEERDYPDDVLLSFLTICNTSYKLICDHEECGFEEQKHPWWFVYQYEDASCIRVPRDGLSYYNHMEVDSHTGELKMGVQLYLWEFIHHLKEFFNIDSVFAN